MCLIKKYEFLLLQFKNASFITFYYYRWTLIMRRKKLHTFFFLWDLNWNCLWSIWEIGNNVVHNVEKLVKVFCGQTDVKHLVRIDEKKFCWICQIIQVTPENFIIGCMKIIRWKAIVVILPNRINPFIKKSEVTVNYMLPPNVIAKVIAVV